MTYVSEENISVMIPSWKIPQRIHDQKRETPMHRNPAVKSKNVHKRILDYFSLITLSCTHACPTHDAPHVASYELLIYYCSTCMQPLVTLRDNQVQFKSHLIKIQIFLVKVMPTRIY